MFLELDFIARKLTTCLSFSLTIFWHRLSPFPIIIDCQFCNWLISEREAKDLLQIIIDYRPNTSILNLPSPSYWASRGCALNRSCALNRKNTVFWTNLLLLTELLELLRDFLKSLIVWDSHHLSVELLRVLSPEDKNGISGGLGTGH